MSRARDNALRSAARFIALACAGVLSLVCFPPANAQSSSNSTTPAAASQPSSASAAAPTKPTAKPKHVITNDDLEPHGAAASGSQDEKIMPGESPLLACDSSCENAARHYLGYDSEDEEADWREQIVQARRDLAADDQWRGLLSQAIQQTNSYCNFLQQASQKTAPSGNDYRSRVERAQNSRYFSDMDRNLRQSLDRTANQMQQHIQDAQVLSPVRGALMYVQADRILNRDCEPPVVR
ncbi:MAG TPA: hypothetical protein VL128_14190 [Candidatus Eisenbacteria bacterium]|nr:hypothetical protein [Candidatus Eisenbacteria bacterium]